MSFECTETESETETETETEDDICRLQETLRRTREAEHVRVSEQVKAEPSSGIRRALSLNRALQEKLERLTIKLVEMYEDRLDRIERIRREISPMTMTEPPRPSFRNFGMPFFKDSGMFPCPRNSEAALIAQSGLLNYYSFISPPHWTERCKRDLDEAVHGILKKNEKEKLTKELERLKETKPPAEKAMKEVRKRLVGVERMTLKELAGPLNQKNRIDWFRVASDEKRHSSHECRIMWEVYAHPSINKGPWSEDEMKALRKGLFRGLQGGDWDDLANGMATGRTGFQCFVYARRMIGDPEMSKRAWTEEEDEYLKTLIEECRIGDFIPWNRIAYYLDRRSREQAYNRWKDVHCVWRTGRFLSEEDAVLVAAVHKYGCDYKKIIMHLPGRVSRHVRKRYQLLSSLSGSSWTPDEDRRLLRAIHTSVCKFQDIDFPSVTENFPGRTETELKTRGILLGALTEDTDVVYLDENARIDAALDRASTSLQKKLATMEPTKVTYKDQFKNTRLNRSFINYFKNLHFRKLKLSTHQIPRGSDSNISDIKVVLSVLQAKLNKENVQSHLITNESKELFENILKPKEPENSTIKKIKTYSRKSAVKPIENPPSSSTSKSSNTTTDLIYSSPKLQFVLPPCLSTLNSLKKCMSYVGYKLIFDDSRYKKDHLHPKIKLWHDRIQALFYWAILLSNVTPNFSSDIFTEHLIVNAPDGTDTKKSTSKRKR